VGSSRSAASYDFGLPTGDAVRGREARIRDAYAARVPGAPPWGVYVSTSPRPWSQQVMADHGESFGDFSPASVSADT
jgi:hypothetical protein